MQNVEFLESMTTGVILGKMMQDDELAEVAKQCDHSLFKDHHEAVKLTAKVIDFKYGDDHYDWVAVNRALNLVAEKICKIMKSGKKVAHTDLYEDGDDWWLQIETALSAEA